MKATITLIIVMLALGCSSQKDPEVNPGNPTALTGQGTPVEKIELKFDEDGDMPYQGSEKSDLKAFIDQMLACIGTGGDIRKFVNPAIGLVCSSSALEHMTKEYLPEKQTAETEKFLTDDRFVQQWLHNKNALSMRGHIHNNCIIGKYISRRHKTSVGSIWFWMDLVTKVNNWKGHILLSNGKYYLVVLEPQLRPDAPR